MTKKYSSKKPESLTPNKKKYVQRYFDTTLYPIITPMAVDGGPPFSDAAFAYHSLPLCGQYHPV